MGIAAYSKWAVGNWWWPRYRDDDDRKKKLQGLKGQRTKIITTSYLGMDIGDTRGCNDWWNWQKERGNRVIRPLRGLLHVRISLSSSSPASLALGTTSTE